MASKKEKDDSLQTAKMASIVDSLSKKFDEEKIQERKVEGGKLVKYVKAQEYIVKLNEIFGVAWSFEIKNHWLVNNNIVMWVRITYPNPDNTEQLFFKDGIAGHPLSGNIGNVFKSVYSKAFTKAAAQIGAGLHLWGVDSEEDEAPNWDNYNAGGPPVHTVNPGAHNPLPPVPGVGPATPPPLPQAPQQYQGQGSSLPAPPVPTGAPPVPSGYGAPPPPPPGTQGPTPPEFHNPNPAAPPVPQGMGQSYTPPLPTGNPNPGQSTGYSQTLPDGSVTPASASIGINSAGQNDRIVDFQINGIIGAAVTRGMADNPMRLVAQILGPQFENMDIRQLTMQQAQDVMDAVHKMPPQ